MHESVANDLDGVVDAAAPELRAIDDTVASRKLTPDVWSVKEILGHLIDSASNNHQRFVRAQLAGELSFPGYEQNAWVVSQDYQRGHWRALVDLWVAYNHHLAHVIRRIPHAAADVPCRIGTRRSRHIGLAGTGLLGHMRHHLEQIRTAAGRLTLTFGIRGPWSGNRQSSGRPEPFEA